MIFEVGDQTHESTIQVLESSGLRERTQRWYIELPTVLWLLDRVAAGDISATNVAALLRENMQWTSGCCSLCDAAADSYPDALRRHEEMRSNWQREQERMTPESHPYLLNRGRIHAWNCAHAGRASSPGHPGQTLHSYAKRYDFFSGDTTRMFTDLREETLVCRRATTDDILERLSRRNPQARDPRCKLCSPELPGAWRSETSDVHTSAEH